MANRTAVPFCTGVPPDSATNALTSVEPPAGSTRAPDVTVTVEAVGATSGILSHAITASWASTNAAAPACLAWLRTWFRIILTSLRRAFRRARSARAALHVVDTGLGSDSARLGSDIVVCQVSMRNVNGSTGIARRYLSATRASSVGE